MGAKLTWRFSPPAEAHRACSVASGTIEDDRRRDDARVGQMRGRKGPLRSDPRCSVGVRREVRQTKSSPRMRFHEAVAPCAARPSQSRSRAARAVAQSRRPRSRAVAPPALSSCGAVRPRCRVVRPRCRAVAPCAGGPRCRAVAPFAPLCWTASAPPASVGAKALVSRAHILDPCSLLAPHVEPPRDLIARRSSPSRRGSRRRLTSAPGLRGPILRRPRTWRTASHEANDARLRSELRRLEAISVIELESSLGVLRERFEPRAPREPPPACP